MENMEKEIIERYRYNLFRKINYYNKILQSLIDEYDERYYQEILEEKRMVIFCLDLLTEIERNVYNKKERD